MRNGSQRSGAGRHEMRTSTSDRLTRATTEQLLDGGPGPAGLHQLLSAAAGPGTESELAGETAALAAFVDAPRASAPLPSAPTRRPTMLSTALSKILAAKALAAVVLLAGATGGVALAATVSSPSSSPSDDKPAATATATPSEDPEPESDEKEEIEAAEETEAAKPERTATPSPEPSFDGLCKAWAAGNKDDRGKAAENPAFSALVEAAGSPDDVPGYCAARAADNKNERSGQVTEEPKAPSDDEPGANSGRGVPPTAAPGNPDRPAGPPADGAKKNGNQQDADEQEDDEKEKDDAQQNKGANSKSGGSAADRRPTS